MSEQKESNKKPKKNSFSINFLIFVVVLVGLFILDRQGIKKDQQLVENEIDMTSIENHVNSVVNAQMDTVEAETADLGEAELAQMEKAVEAKEPVMMTSRWIKDLEEENEFLDEVYGSEDTATDEPVVDVVQEDAQPVEMPTKYANEVKTCKNKNFGVSFPCNLNWEVNEGQESYSIVVLKDPEVVMGFKKVNEKVRFLGQITKEYIESLNEYKEGFNKKYSTFAGRKAILLRGYSLNNQRREDYFYAYNNQVHRVSFAVPSESAWEQSRPVIQDMVKEFALLDE